MATSNNIQASDVVFNSGIKNEGLRFWESKEGTGTGLLHAFWYMPHHLNALAFTHDNDLGNLGQSPPAVPKEFEGQGRELWRQQWP
jgi:hypothetical protein